MVSEETWRNLWAEWQDKRHKLRASLELPDEKCKNYIDDLDEALTLISKLSILYETLSSSLKQELLNQVLERVVVSLEGEIVPVDLLPPFSYLVDVCEKVGDGATGSGATSSRSA